MRLDLYLLEHGFADSRQKAVYRIQNGEVRVNGVVNYEPSTQTAGKTVEVVGEGLRYVSRGGLKLEGALKAFAFDPTGLVCVDLGASTGGFTDCLLQNGARRVYALDVGHGQLDEKLRNDERVVNIEGFNVRDLRADMLPEPVALAVSDLSFISQRLIYLPLSTVLVCGAPFVSLIKPQFEVGPKDVGKRGIVKNRKAHERVILELKEEAQNAGLILTALTASPIPGGDGNREYLALFYNRAGSLLSDSAIKKVVYGD